MDHGVKEQGKSLKAERDDIQEKLRMHRRVKRSTSTSGIGSGGVPRDNLRGVRDGYNKPAALTAPSRPGHTEWQSHHDAWEIFQDSPPEPLFVEMVPWPPCVDDVLEFYEYQEQGDRKKAYRLACRRWHPDKFLQRYGSLVPPHELAYMTFRINEVFQAVTAQWERLK